MRALSPLDDLVALSEQMRGARDVAVRRRQEAHDQIKQLETELELQDLVQEATRTLIDREVQSGIAVVEALLTEGLRTVFFDQKLAVKANISVNRGKVSVDLVTTHEREDGTVIEGVSPDAFGGAVSTVQSVLLRVIVMRRRGLRSFMLLDETLPAVDGTYVQHMGEFLRLLCERLGIDMLLVTHNPALVEAANRAFRIVPTKNGARFEKIL